MVHKVSYKYIYMHKLNLLGIFEWCTESMYLITFTFPDIYNKLHIYCKYEMEWCLASVIVIISSLQFQAVMELCTGGMEHSWLYNIIYKIWSDF